jgi:hypothetical protein
MLDHDDHRHFDTPPDTFERFISFVGGAIAVLALALTVVAFCSVRWW